MAPLTHLPHIDDLYLRGAAGVADAVGIVDALMDALTVGSDANAPIDIQVKMDGAPAIVCGIDPTDKKFFLGTKGVFNADPKLAKSRDELRKVFTGGVLPVMTVVWDQLSTRQWRGVYQGDVLWTPELKRSRMIGKTKFWTFQPNTIIYGIPAESPLGKRMPSAVLGIVFHTSYTGTWGRWTPTPLTSLRTLPALPASTVVIPPTYRDVSGTLTLTKRERQEIARPLQVFTRLSTQLKSNLFLRLVSSNRMLSDEMARFNTWLVKEKHSGKSPAKQVTLLQAFIAMTHTDQPTQKAMAAVVNWIGTHARVVEDVLAWRQALEDLKIVFLKKLAFVPQVFPFEPAGRGLTPGQHEGLVAATDGMFVKIIDRDEFSFQNFTRGRFAK